MGRGPLYGPRHGPPTGANPRVSPTRWLGRQQHGYSTDNHKAKGCCLAGGRLSGRIRDHRAVLDLGLPAGGNERSACSRRKAWPRRISRPRSTRFPGANWRTELTKKVCARSYTKRVSGCWTIRNYFFIGWSITARNSDLQTPMSYPSKRMEALYRGGASGGRPANRRPAGNYGTRTDGLRRFWASHDISRAFPLIQPLSNFAMGKKKTLFRIP